MVSDSFDVTFPQTPGGQHKEQILAATLLLREETTDRWRVVETQASPTAVGHHSNPATEHY
jgi:hypothetical protein